MEKSIRNHSEYMCAFWRDGENSCACKDLSMRDIKNVFKMLNVHYKTTYWTSSHGCLTWSDTWAHMSNRVMYKSAGRRGVTLIPGASTKY